ncbi:hypothetical protein CTAM01_16691 [Colletotrichum tamarilloi]|uniref:Uncharacterized protein n=1 Tax=Colletotrichum tamarilloi TaxID=1209934 RepID=A0ABQ9QHV6_9PEZI|nr:uncharacterized protein CTAM01_16691 [Colletotrichum tamarilloi]KAK1470963.1 hypothetical protein CTAM01_16691 [Colletotrichum tamarilloi]
MSDPSSVIAISIQPAAPETWVEFGIMPQLAEAMSREDEWTGTKDAAAPFLPTVLQQTVPHGN